MPLNALSGKPHKRAMNGSAGQNFSPSVRTRRKEVNGTVAVNPIEALKAHFGILLDPFSFVAAVSPPPVLHWVHVMIGCM
jgi:hypothetical protein